MSNESLSKMFECHGEGVVVTPAQNEEDLKGPKIVKTEEDQLPPSPKNEFDPNIITNGLIDGPKEGGTTIARSTGITGMADKAIPGIGMGFKNGGPGGQYELSGFTVRYNVPDSADVGSVEVCVNYPSFDQIRDVIRPGKYFHTTPNGVVIECDITLGGPVIVVNECEKFKYVDGAWIRP